MYSHITPDERKRLEAEGKLDCVRQVDQMVKLPQSHIPKKKKKNVTYEDISYII